MFKWMVVRHPMDRLLSAYLEKVLDEAGQHSDLGLFRDFVTLVGRSLIANRTQEQNRTKEEQVNNYNRTLCYTVDEARTTLQSLGLPDLQDYFDYLLSSSLQEDGGQNKNVTLNRCYKVPTFEEFLEYVLSTNLLGNI